MVVHEASWSAPSWLLLFSPSPSKLPGLPPGSDLLRVTSASVTSATVIQIRIYQQSWETFPGLKCSEACDSRIQGCATSETNKHSHVYAVVLLCQTWQTDDIACPSGLYRELCLGMVLCKGFLNVSLFWDCPLQMQGKKEVGVPEGRLGKLLGQTEKTTFNFRSYIFPCKYVYFITGASLHEDLSDGCYLSLILALAATRLRRGA